MNYSNVICDHGLFHPSGDIFIQ